MTQLKMLPKAALVVAAAMSIPAVTLAQDTRTGSASDKVGTTPRSWLPFTTHGYVGVSGGQSKFRVDCVAGFSCDEKDDGAFKVFTGGRFRNVLGLELSYVNFGEAQRAGRDTEAQALDLSLTGNLPLFQRLSLFGRVGGTYGWTRTRSNSPALRSGKDDDLGLSYGGGLNVDIADSWAVRAEWERHRLKFADERADADLYSIGVTYKFR